MASAAQLPLAMVGPDESARVARVRGVAGRAAALRRSRLCDEERACTTLGAAQRHEEGNTIVNSNGSSSSNRNRRAQNN